MLITLEGMRVGQLNALTQIDMGDYRFGFPVRITARTHAGREGVVNIEREVEMSGPIHDKGVLILQSYLSALFGHLAPLALNALHLGCDFVGVLRNEQDRLHRLRAGVQRHRGRLGLLRRAVCAAVLAVGPGAAPGHRRGRRSQPAWRGATRGRAE